MKLYNKKLSNGLKIIFEKRNLPIVSFAIAVKRGGIHETSSERGISHLIEHMLYKGTKKRNSKQIAEEIEKRGGILNGFTDETLTAYWCKLQNKHLEIAFDILSDMIKNPLFDKIELEKEKKVIIEEIKMYKNDPMSYVNLKIQECLYKKPFSIPLIGTEKILKDITREKLIKEHQNSYQPRNMFLCVVGGADFNEIVRLAKKYFLIENKKTRIKKYIPIIKNTEEKEKRKDLDQAHLILGYHTKKLQEKGSYASYILSYLMAGGISSRLFQEIREKRNLAYAITHHTELRKDYAYSTIYAGIKKNSIEEVKKLILDEFEKISKDLGEEEFNKIKEQVIGNNYILKEDSLSRMIEILYDEANDNLKKENFEENIRKIKIDDVKNLAKSVLKKHSLFVLSPN
ncbi:MAG: peptidase M16 [Candidatus Pacearchaeota archaeon]|nr:MAG: peptidase M16 [Candidatus Pacearchaeota archaeon]